MAEYKILDVSCHNGIVDFTQVKKAGYTGVILRAGFGKSITQKDKCFDKYYKEIIDRKISLDKHATLKYQQLVTKLQK